MDTNVAKGQVREEAIAAGVLRCIAIVPYTPPRVFRVMPSFSMQNSQIPFCHVSENFNRIFNGVIEQLPYKKRLIEVYELGQSVSDKDFPDLFDPTSQLLMVDVHELLRRFYAGQTELLVAQHDHFNNTIVVCGQESVKIHFEVGKDGADIYANLSSTHLASALGRGDRVFFLKP